MSLTSKQFRFIDEYLVDLNATQAAIRAGYSKKTARQAGSENLSKPAIFTAIRDKQKEVSEKAEWSAAERLAALKRISAASEANDPRVAVSAISEANKMQGSHAPAKRTIVVRDCEVNGAHLIYPNGATENDKATINDDLAALGIIVR